MATITANVTASLSANGNTTSTGSLSWTKPSIPVGATISSIVLTGSFTWNGKGNVTITINGTNCISATPFTINLPTNTTSPYSITCRGGNKNATGNNFTWSSLIVTYTYSIKYNISVGSLQNGKVIVSPSGSVDGGTMITITATPNTGYKIGNYYVNGSLIDSNTFIANTDSIVTVTFEELTQSIYMKDTSIWRTYSKIYKKVNNIWSLQSDFSEIFDPLIKYTRGG